MTEFEHALMAERTPSPRSPPSSRLPTHHLGPVLRKVSRAARVIIDFTHTPCYTLSMGHPQVTTLLDAVRYFSDPDVCLNYLIAQRWPDGKITCPTCDSQEVHFI